MHPLYSVVCGLFAVFAASTSLRAATPAPAKKASPSKTAEPAFVEHKVKKGETLWGIAQKHSTSVGEIMDCNRLPNETVRDGMTLKIPGRKKNIPIKLNPTREPETIREVAPRSKPSAPTSNPAGSNLHTVAENETFYSISKKYGLPMESLVAANPAVKPELLREGMKIVVPKPSSPKNKDSSAAALDNKTKSSASGTAALTTARKSLESHASDKPKTAAATPIPSTDAKKESPVTKPVVVSSKPVVTKPEMAKPETAVEDGVILSYIVSAGEDENTISEAFGITKKQLLEYNRLSNSTNLKPGDEIMIPRAVR